MWAGTIRAKAGSTGEARIVDQVTRDKITELRGEADQEWALNRRKECLSDLMADLIVDYWYERARHADYVARGRMLEDMMTQERMRAIRKQITKHQNEIYYRRKAMSGEQVGVTADEVRQAKERPFEGLLPVVKGKVGCPFHEDNHPSASVRNNKLHCFVCNRTWDTIDFWMEINGRSFSEAVRSLL